LIKEQITTPQQGSDTPLYESDIAI
jgi:hypothetical protein